MSNLIKREDAIRAIDLWFECNSMPKVGRGILFEVPSADRPSGKWTLCHDSDGVYGVCSICGEDADFSHYGVTFNYCPSCGARMKGADNGI